MNKLKFAVVILLLAAVSEGIAIDSPFSFLRYVSSARASGLSGSFVAMEDDPTSMYFNPATVSTITTKPLSVTFLKHVLDINSGNVSYTHHTGEDGSLAASIGYTSYGAFEYADGMGNRDGRTFGANDFLFGVSYSNELDKDFYYGLTLKYIFTGIEEVSTSAVAFDAGLLYLLPDGRTNLAMSILHIGTQITKIGNQNEPLPLDFRVGFNHRLQGLPILFNLSLHHLSDQADNFFDRFKRFNVGAEINLGEYIQARLGYDNEARSLTSSEVDKGLTGFSGGIGVKTDMINFDYGFTRYGSAVNLHRFSISLGVQQLF